MPLHFVFCLHNHQPVGNFGFVLEKAYQESYVPFTDVLGRHPSMKVVLHFSGILYRWLEDNHPSFLDRLAGLAGEGRVEFLSGGFYEPILAVIPEWDRIGQIGRMSSFIWNRFGQKARGLWLAERVWEPDLPRAITAAGLVYVVVDDYHLRAAGVPGEEITRPYLTGDGDRVLTVIGGSEKLRYFIPYEEPEKTIDFLREIHERDPMGRQMVVMADDGEKFGVWPGTHRRVYQEGWLDAFFAALESGRPWLEVTTFGEALRAVPPEEPVYMPTVSYMEMSEWALPAEAGLKYKAVEEIVGARGDLGYTGHFLRGGYWRNFLSKYPESRYLWGRMTDLSGKLRQLEERAAARAAPPRVEIGRAREELWQGQCNDAYWHGVFGGLYLPFLRAAAYEHLLKAESAMEGMEQEDGDFLSLEEVDLDGDGRKEMVIRNRPLTLAVDPETGMALEMSYKPAHINLTNALNRREEAYHRRLIDLPRADDDRGARSIHHQEKMREGHEVQDLVFDGYPRRSMVDHVWRGDYTWEEWKSGRRAEVRPGKVRYGECRSTMDDRSLILEMTAAPGDGWPRMSKVVSLDRAAAMVRVKLSADGPGGAAPFFIGQEFNLTPTSLRESPMKASDASGRRFDVPFEGGKFPDVVSLRLLDRFASLSLTMTASSPVVLWVSPLCTVSNSEAGFEEICQQISILLWRKVLGEVLESLDMAVRMDKINA